MNELHRDWTTSPEGHLVRTFSFPDFATALAFVNQVGEIAEDQDHHPDVWLRWGSVRLELWTHDLDAVTGRDHRLAHAIDGLPAART